MADVKSKNYKQVAPAVTDPDLRQRSQEMGLLGRLFGSREHAPINIAGALIIMGTGGMIWIALVATSPSTPDILKALAALVLASLTFLGGYLGGKDKR
jgi:hypothetical protein